MDADYAMCLARTNWDVPKHRGLTMFIVQIHQPGVTVEQIRQVDGSMEFCQEFFDDVRAARRRRRRRDRRRLDHRVGAPRPRAARRRRRLAVPERPLRAATTPPRTTTRSPRWWSRQGRRGDPHVRRLVAEAHDPQDGPPPAQPAPHRRDGGGEDGRASRLDHEAVRRRQHDAPLGDRPGDRRARRPWRSRTSATRGHPGEQLGVFSLIRQGGSLGGGSNEIQRNIISERLLGLPREHAADREVPYREVQRGGARP